MRKSMKIIISVVVTLILAISIFAIVWFTGKSYKQFYAKAQEEFAIPGLADGYVPQGITYYQDGECFLSAGYMKDGSSSRIYIIGESTKFFTLKLNGNDYTGHAGGISTYQNYGYLVGDKLIYIFDISQAIELENGKSIEILGYYDAPNGADFINIQNGKMYIGEFYHETKYPTSELHHIKSADGTNYAITFVYDMINKTDDTPYYFNIDTPAFAISTTEKIQGMCINGTEENSEIILSASWSLSDSKIYIHKGISDIAPTKYIHNNIDIDLYILDSSTLKETLEIPSMSEEITLKDGRVYVIFENACSKYKFVTRHKNTKAISFEVSKMLEKD